MASGQVRSVSSLLLRPLDRGRAYAKYCDQRVCMSVCSHISKTSRPNFTKFSVHVTCSRGTVLPDGKAMHYVLPVLWMTPFFRTLAQIQIQACSHRRSELFAATRQVAPPNCARGGGKDCYNCSRGGRRSLLSSTALCFLLWSVGAVLAGRLPLLAWHVHLLVRRVRRLQRLQRRLRRKRRILRCVFTAGCLRSSDGSRVRWVGTYPLASLVTV